MESLISSVGTSIMVAPVYQPETKCAVYLPGGEWFGFYTGKVIGESHILAEAL